MTFTFWRAVYNLKKREDDSELFSNLYKFVMLLFSLSHSSVSIERIFSILNFKKKLK